MASVALFPAAKAGCFSVRERPALVLQRLATAPKLAGVTAASRLETRPRRAMAESGIGELDGLTGGLPRGCLTEICGPPSSGRTSVLLAALAAATRRQEACALVDASDALDPVSAAASGADFQKLLWVRCGGASAERSEKTAKARSWQRRWPREEPGVEQALRVTDLLLQSGGFGLVVMDLGDISFALARRIPLTSWFRFQRAVEHTPTIFLLLSQAPCTRSCAALLLRVQAGGQRRRFEEEPEGPAHARLLRGTEVEGELLQSRLERKPAASTAFATQTAWAG